MAPEPTLTPDEVEVSAPIDAGFVEFDNDPTDPVTEVCSTVGGQTHCT